MMIVWSCNRYVFSFHLWWLCWLWFEIYWNADACYHLCLLDACKGHFSWSGYFCPASFSTYKVCFQVCTTQQFNPQNKSVVAIHTNRLQILIGTGVRKSFTDNGVCSLVVKTITTNMAAFNLSEVDFDTYVAANIAVQACLLVVIVLPTLTLTIICSVAISFTQVINWQLRVALLNIFLEHIIAPRNSTTAKLTNVHNIH